MAKFETNKIIRGNFGSVWVNNKEFAEVKSFEAKVTLEYEDVQKMGKMGTSRRLMGTAGEGTMVIHKIDSKIVKMISDSLKNKKDIPEISITAKLADPSADGEERVKLSGVTLDEIMVMKFENKELREEEVPFKFEEHEMIDTIG